VSGVELPIPLGNEDEVARTVAAMMDQLDHHLIPRVREQASPALVVVAGSTGAGKSTVVNALLGEELTASGVLRPTTKVPHLFHHPLDADVLSSVAARAKVHATEAVPRGLAIVDSPDLDSVRGENREIAEGLLEVADLWIFVTTAARYGDAVPWEALRKGAERGASIAMVLNRVTIDAASEVRRELVARLAQENLESLPLFVIPEDTEAAGQLPRDVVNGLGRWLDSVASASAATIVERTMHGATESLKEWLEQLAEWMDDQSAAAKDVRSEVRRRAIDAEVAGGDDWFREVPTGSMAARWEQAGAEGGPFHRVRNSVWAKRRSARDQRDDVLREVYVDIVESVESSLALAASDLADALVETLTEGDHGPGKWLADLRDPRQARVKRERHVADATRTWLAQCAEIVGELPGAERGAEVIGADGLTTTLASAALGIESAQVTLAILTTPNVDAAVEQARALLAAARRYCLNKESLDLMKPTDVASLMPDASSKVRLRRAELRGLL
jgi:GTPase SAR1 family protein